jgi:predicted acetyltransferase
MIFRQAKQEEIMELFREGHLAWPRNRTFDQYCNDNGKEDAYGTRYVIEKQGEIVSSLILLNLKSINGCKVYGIGSVLTPSIHKHKGYATELIACCIDQIVDKASMTFLYSEIDPSFYERFHFRVLPNDLQKDQDSICMVRCDDVIWKELLSMSVEMLPDHF